MTLIIFSFKNGEQNMSYTILCKNHFYFLIKKKACKIQDFSQGSSFIYLGYSRGQTASLHLTGGQRTMHMAG